jgi:hypothetical protein
MMLVPFAYDPARARAAQYTEESTCYTDNT